MTMIHSNIQKQFQITATKMFHVQFQNYVQTVKYIKKKTVAAARHTRTLTLTNICGISRLRSKIVKIISPRINDTAPKNTDETYKKITKIGSY